MQNGLPIPTAEKEIITRNAKTQMEREKKSLAKVKAVKSGDAVVPSFSFAPKDGAPKYLTPEDFQIANHESQITFVAYYDPSHKLIFVIDKTLDARTPNTMLVINPDANNALRKWDDILATDYAVDLETVRPKKNNKYQKLDIEYDGLTVYNRLINSFNAGEDLTNAVAELDEFRNRAASNIANMRLAAADAEIQNATDTIAATDARIKDTAAEIKRLRDKLAKAKAKIGKEPPRESAAKILRMQSKADALTEKQKRAETRLRRAKRRIADAKREAEAAAKRLAALSKPVNEIKHQELKPKAKKMSDEVQPLFEQDPKIMNEEIAFKPVEFAAPQPMPTFAQAPAGRQDFVPPPISAVEFEPPAFGAAPEPEIRQHAPPPPPEITEAPEPHTILTNTAAYTDVESLLPSQSQPEPAVAPPPPPPPASAPPPRPASANNAAEVTVTPLGRQRPSAIYYVMLAILIALSIMTLYLYQNKMSDTVPNLTERPREVASAQVFDDNPSAYVQPRAVAPQPMPVVEPVQDGNPFLDAGPVTAVPPIGRLPDDFEGIIHVSEPEPEPVYVEPEPEAITLPIHAVGYDPGEYYDERVDPYNGDEANAPQITDTEDADLFPDFPGTEEERADAIQNYLYPTEEDHALAEHENYYEEDYEENYAEYPEENYIE
ncbi:MAG: hypothetical protein FWG18_01555 [Alphaproteobacteria bacterium]|nr:hypothetical protein [Alphaproteobacteria bacterium]